MIFIDLKKVYDKIPREVLWWTMTKKGVPREFVDPVKDMH